MKIMMVLAGFVLMIAYCVISTSDTAQAEEVLGTGTNELLGGDLTDPILNQKTMVILNQIRITMPFSQPTMNPDSRAGNLRLTSSITALAPAMTNGAADVGAAFRMKVYT